MSSKNGAVMGWNQTKCSERMWCNRILMWFNWILFVMPGDYPLIDYDFPAKCVLFLALLFAVGVGILQESGRIGLLLLGGMSLNFPFYIHFFISIYESTYLPIYLSICLSVCLSIYLSINVSINVIIYQSMYLSIYLSIYLPTYLPTYLFGEYPQFLHKPMGVWISERPRWCQFPPVS